MSALLLYSERCQHCKSLMEFVNSNGQLKQLVKYHDVNRNGVPQQYAKQITRVPTMLTKNGKILVGNEIKQWLTSLLPNELTNWSITGSSMGTSLDDTEEDEGSFFSLESYGRSLQPAMTQELQDRISKNVNEAYNSNKR